ncbi:MAG TPA: ABC transporter permease subunit, partial [Saprospiraceae bacterium]|nr:ABC transporter permease subunit [Saprospiraceae bacterium]
IMEVLFNIPGMGRLAYQSIISRDWPVLFNIILISGIITVLAQILTDILYAWLDPRINTGK